MHSDERYWRDLERRAARSDYFRQVVTKASDTLSAARFKMAKNLGVNVNRITVVQRGNDIMFSLEGGIPS